MKTLFAMFFALLAPTSALCQERSPAEEAIERIINLGFLEGHDQKAIGGLGDNAAVIVTKVVGERKLSAPQIERVLLVLKSAFGDIPATPDREPKTTLFVLQMLDLSTKDLGLRKKIAETRQYIEESSAKSKQK
jgi:hypothetical protein